MVYKMQNVHNIYLYCICQSFQMYIKVSQGQFRLQCEYLRPLHFIHNLKKVHYSLQERNLKYIQTLNLICTFLEILIKNIKTSPSSLHQLTLDFGRIVLPILIWSFLSSPIFGLLFFTNLCIGLSYLHQSLVFNLHQSMVFYIFF